LSVVAARFARSTAVAIFSDEATRFSNGEPFVSAPARAPDSSSRARCSVAISAVAR